MNNITDDYGQIIISDESVSFVVDYLKENGTICFPLAVDGYTQLTITMSLTSKAIPSELSLTFNGAKRNSISVSIERIGNSIFALNDNDLYPSYVAEKLFNRESSQSITVINFTDFLDRIRKLLVN